MAKKRVYEIAKEQKLSSAEVIGKLQAAGVEVGGALSGVEAADVDKVFGSGKATAKPAKPAAARPAPAAGKKPAVAPPKKTAAAKPAAQSAKKPAGKKPAAASKTAPPAAEKKPAADPPAQAEEKAPDKKTVVKRAAPKPEMHGKRRRVIIDPSTAKRRAFVPAGRQRSKSKGHRKGGGRDGA
ncbi:MAG: translation initiation factor IF-2 N-terminal domain-containing protein, partial [Thermoleophilia bacterium]